MREAIESTLSEIKSLLDQPASERNLTPLFERIEALHGQYIKTIQQALSYLVRNEQEKCQAYLQSTRDDLEDVKAQIAGMLADGEPTNDPVLILAMEYAFTRARLVDEIRSFPSFAVDLLERLTLDESLDETIAWLEAAMTGKKNLYKTLMQHQP